MCGHSSPETPSSQGAPRACCLRPYLHPPAGFAAQPPCLHHRPDFIALPLGEHRLSSLVLRGLPALGALPCQRRVWVCAYDVMFVDRLLWDRPQAFEACPTRAVCLPDYLGTTPACRPFFGSRCVWNCAPGPAGVL